MDSHNEVWWTIDGKKPDDVTVDITINERYPGCMQVL
jgi:interleukin 1 receptor accessory protein